MPLITIFYIILLVCASALCIALIVYLNRITKSIKQIEVKVNDLSTELKPLITSTTELTGRLNDLSDDAREQVDSVKNIITAVQDRVDVILDFEESVRGGLEQPIKGLLKNLSAFYNGVNTFVNAYKKNHR
jgi:uncharacterized protein YoxC